MKRTLSAVGKFIYGIIMTAAVIGDLVITVWLFKKGHAGWGIAYLFIGWSITLTVAHWIGLLLASPFVVAGALTERSRFKQSDAVVYASAAAQWDTGPLLSAEQCVGTVEARDAGLMAVAESGTSAQLDWDGIESYGVATEDSKLVISAAAPSFWFFVLEPEDEGHRDEWIEILEANGVTKASSS